MTVAALVDPTMLWAKTAPGESPDWLPLYHHLLDVACCAEAILAREPETSLVRISGALGLSWSAAAPWISLLIACHDLGKACPGFQAKWDGCSELLALAGLRLGACPDTKVNHAYVSQVFLSRYLEEAGWPFELADLASDAMGCHHGFRAAPTLVAELPFRDQSVGDERWDCARRMMFKSLHDLFSPLDIPTKQTLSGPDYMLLAGLTSFADWIGSNRDWFPLGTPEECRDLASLYTRRKACAERALSGIGWEPRCPLLSERISFADMFSKFSPRPLQLAVEDAIQSSITPPVILVEAPMGEGKSEAAFYAHAELQRKHSHRGLYVALPTRATGNAMFERTLQFLQSLDFGAQLDLQLLHGSSLLNERYQQLKIRGVYDDDGNGQIRASEWFTHKKRALLSDYGVGTVDQALLTILPVKHQFVRIWGLANRTVIFDEIHAYDTYTGTLLITLVEWLQSLGSSVILLSATLPPSFRRQLAKRLRCEFVEPEAAYPRISIFGDGQTAQRTFASDAKRRRDVVIKPIGIELEALKDTVRVAFGADGYALVLLNTVQRAQKLFQSWGHGVPIIDRDVSVGKTTPDGEEVYLFHGSYPGSNRQVREERALSIFGNGTEGASQSRTGRKILIATQVVEQSLDLDFDVMVTDLAPIDLLLQRAGRLWRHQRPRRPVPSPILFVAGLDADRPPSFGRPLWWGKIYREDCLLRTWLTLKERDSITLPDEIDSLVRAVYETQDDKLPEWIVEPLLRARTDAEGVDFANRGSAYQEIIGFPNDGSWNDPSRFAKYDDDEPGVHRSLVAKTRIGDPSLLAIPLFPSEHTEDKLTPALPRAKDLYIRGVAVSRKHAVQRLSQLNVPVAWRESPLLRNCYPLKLDSDGRWCELQSVYLDSALGLVFESQEGK